MKKRAFLRVVPLLSLILFGFGCSGENYQPPANVALTQGHPPEGCGERFPDRFTPYFTIPQNTITLGETIYLDATCSTGRISQVEWDFDLETWPESVPREQAFQAPIPIDNLDLTDPASTYIDNNPSPTIDDKHWPFNNSGAFLQTYTPQTVGLHTARLRATDYRGRRHTVISQYVVTNPMAGKVSESMNAQYVLANNVQTSLILGSRLPIIPPPRPDAPTVLVPWHTGGMPIGGVEYISLFTGGKNITLLHPELSGPIYTYRWEIFGTPADRISRFVSTSTEDRPINQLQSTKLSITAPMYPTTNPRDDILPNSRFPYLVTFQLWLTDKLKNEVSSDQTYTFIDPLSSTQLVPQLVLIPNNADGTTNVSAIHTRIVWPGQEIFLQSFSILRKPSLQGELITQFDTGSGTWEEVERIPARNAGIEYYSNVDKKFRAPLTPGNYVAKIRLIDSGIPGKSNEAEAETTLTYTVALPPSLRVDLTARPITAQTGEQVIFDGGGSTGDIAEYHWKIVDKNSGIALHEEVKSAGLPTRADQVAWQFQSAGRFQTSLEIKEKVTGTLQKKEIEYTVHPRQAVGRGRLPDMTPLIYPVGVAHIPGVQKPLIPYDRGIIYHVKGLTNVAERVEWDFDGNGVVDERCTVTLIAGTTVSCEQIIKNPPHARTGDQTAVVTIFERNGQGQVQISIPYTISPGNRGRTDQLGKPTQVTTEPSPTVPQGHGSIDIRMSGINSNQGPVFSAGASLTFSPMLTDPNLAVDRVEWDFDGDGTVDETCQTVLPDGRTLICTGAYVRNNITIGRHTAQVVINGGAIILTREYEVR